MRLPVDIKALLDEGTNLQAAHEIEIAVSVHIDSTAPSDLAAHVRNAFASSLPTVRMTLTYLGEGFVAQPTDDIAVIVAGESPNIGKDVAAIRAVGVPVMVVAADPVGVASRAEQAGFPLLAHDLIAPDIAPAPELDAEAEAKAVADGVARTAPADGKPGPAKMFASLRRVVQEVVVRGSGAVSPEARKAAEQGAALAPLADDGLLPLTDERARNLDTKMGRWIVSVCRDKRLAYAIAFPFVRRPLARDAVQNTALQNAAVGLVPFIPGADLPIMTLNQAKMVLQIGAAYGQRMDWDRWKEVLAVIGAAYVTRGLTRRLVGAVPVLGFAIRTGVAYGVTAAMGYGVIEYFEGGQNMTGVANVIEHAAAAGTKAVGTVRTALEKHVPALEPTETLQR